ncbi:hypothetical protein SAMN04515666_101356 [Bosea lupini]|uniref:Uncharacterized protein n=1 Tax=Bosea lupini TaxID=1036779 RepID=A0A1H7GIW3_9HYPH|nr:hypothetical protein [Bosea lupini]SEK37487.1 hypothetical protein SAMN04515666_101356 [Bosea lupini]
MSFFLGETREREIKSFATGDEFRGFTETLGDAWRGHVAEGRRYAEGYSEADLDRINGAQGRLFTAARRSSELVDSWSSRANAMAEAYDNRIDTVRRVTGVTLENPERNAYYKEAEADYRLLREQGTISLHDVQNGDNFASRRIELQRAVFNRKVDELAQSQPDKASALVFGQSIEEQARAIAASAAAELDTARKDVGGAAGFMTEIGGALAGMWREPANVAALFAGGGPGTAASVTARLGQVFLREGAINAGVEALQQPDIQAWRRELSLKSGLEPALENIGIAFLFGGAIGGGVQGLRETFGSAAARLSDADRTALGNVLRGEATPAEVEQAAKAMGVQLDDAARADLALAGRVGADDATLPEPPAGIARGDHNEALADAVRFAEDADAPPPAAPLDGQRLRGAITERPALAVYGDEPPQTVLGLAALRDDVWRAVEAGEVDPVHAAWIGRMVPDAPENHGSLLLALQASRPETVAEARLVIRDAMASAERYRTAQASILGAIDDGLDRLARQVDPDLFAAVDAVEARLAGLRAELARLDQPAEGAAVLAPRIASLESELAGISGKRRSSPRAQALRDEIERLKGDQDLLRRTAREQAAATEQVLRLGIADASMDRARLGPQLRRALEAAEASPEVAALRERLAGLTIEPPKPREPPQLRPQQTIEPGSPEAIRQTEALLPPERAAADDVAGKVEAPPGEAVVSDLLPVAAREDGRDMRAMTLADALREAGRPDHLGDIVASCKL